MQNFVELLKDHALILAATGSLTAITRKEAPDAGAAFDALRRLTRLLDTHLREEAQFLDADRDAGHNEFSALASEHGERFDDLVQEWTVYLREWNEEHISDDWSTFARATDWMMRRLGEQIEAENQSLYPAALRYGMIRLLPEKVHAA